MKTRKIGLIISVVVALAACKKETAAPGSTSVKLTVLTYFKDNHDETRTDKSGALNSTSYYGLTNDNGTLKLFLNLGVQGDVHTQSVFGIGFTFENKTQPETISSTYGFPASNANVTVILRNQVAPGRDETVLLPVYGKATFTYDAVSRKISGRIDNLEFNLLGYVPFDRNKIIINGTFENVSLR
ncbi:MAG: hypothetical protein ACRDEB_01775 [Chitinophagaceae bacterium]